VPRHAAAEPTTTASRVKALLLHVQERFGRAEADAFLLKTRLDREYLEDETRPITVERWHAALVAFTSRWGRDELGRVGACIVHHDNLGVWTRVLRGASSPLDAYQRLDHHGGDDVRTELWQLGRGMDGEWRIRVPLRHDPAHEIDGLCTRMRALELAAVPTLFGLQPARVTLVPSDTEQSGAPAAEFAVAWRALPRTPVPIGAGIGLVSAGAAATAGAVGHPVAALLAGLLGGAFVGAAYDAERRRRAQSRAQLVRLHALERAQALRERRESGAAVVDEGTTIAGQYRLGRKLGVGASGAIYEASRLADGAPVALKLLRAAVAHDAVAADRLRREAAALGLAWHPNVVEVFDEGHLPDGTSYLVMERLWGESLAARLRRQGALAPEQLLPIALEVCDALGAVHAAGVIHRDLKPSNIFLSDPAPGQPPSATGGEHVKLLDFGIARVEWAETRLTNDGGPIGTPGYMSPEQEQGGEIDARTDLFSLGGVLYECLSGQPPPIRSSDLWLRADPVDGTPSGVQQALQAIPERWRRVIDRALAPLPRDRFPDARAMREALAGLARSSSQDSAGTG
jgi:serine/threonine-protein kinase